MKVSFIINEYSDDVYYEIDKSEAREFMNMLARKIKSNVVIDYEDLSKYITPDDGLDEILSHFREYIDPKETYDVNITRTIPYTDDDNVELSLKILPERYLKDMSKIPYRLCFIQF